MAGVAIHDAAAQEADQQAAAEEQAETAAHGAAERRLSRKEEKRRRRAERAAKLEAAAITGQDGLAGELQASIAAMVGNLHLGHPVHVLSEHLDRHTQPPQSSARHGLYVRHSCWTGLRAFKSQILT